LVILEVLSGKMAGTRIGVRHFPFRIGRAAQSGLQLEDSGVWDAHAEICLERGAGYQASACDQALLRLNGESVVKAELRAGDVLELGTVKIRFWLGDTAQRSLRFRETVTWLFIAAVLMGQVTLIYLLL
jgi:hypothetical protein